MLIVRVIVLVQSLSPVPLCDPRSPPGCSVRGVSQARILEWVAISFSRGSFQIRDQSPVSGIVSHQGSPTVAGSESESRSVESGSL